MTIEGLTLSLDELVRDDAPITALSWAATVDITGVVADIDVVSRTLRLEGAPGFDGPAAVILTATDAGGLRGSATLTVHVRALAAEPVPGDFDLDGRVTLDDFFRFMDHLGMTVFRVGWNPAFDLAPSGRIDLDDFFLFAEAYEAARTTP